MEDTELVHAVAPDATIREILVDPADVSTPAKLAATWATSVRTAVRNGEVISQSGIGQDFNLGENSCTGAELATMNSALEYAAARHVTVVVASGDYGVLGDGSSTPGREVSLPTSDPWALAVGGTTLTANPATGAYINETTWNAPVQPRLQTGLVAGSAICSPARPTRRAYPASAPPRRPRRRRRRLGHLRHGPRVHRAGRRRGALSRRHERSGAVLGRTDRPGRPGSRPPPRPRQPRHLPGRRSPRYHQAFHDVTSANTVALNGDTITGYQAGPGWDPVTGWGTPDAQVLVPLLAH